MIILPFSWHTTSKSRNSPSSFFFKLYVNFWKKTKSIMSHNIQQMMFCVNMSFVFAVKNIFSVCVECVCISHCIYYYLSFFLSSPELKAQMSYSDQFMYGVCLFVYPSVCKLFTFSTFSPEPLGWFQSKLAQSILRLREFKVVKIKGQAVF